MSMTVFLRCAMLYGIKNETYYTRIKRGLSVENALTNPISVGGRPPKVDS